MDTLCRCGEPWDWWYIRDEVLEDQRLYEKMEKHGGYIAEDDGECYDPQARAMRSLTESRSAKLMTDKEAEKVSCWQFKPGPYPIQCPCCFGKDVEPDPNSDIVEAMQDLLGDDIDGLMAELEDMGLV